VAALAFSKNGKTLASGSETIRLWELPTGKQLKEFDAYHTPRELRGAMPKGIPAIAFSPDGKLLALRHDIGGIIFYDVATGKTIHQLAAGARMAAALSGNGKLAATVEDNGLWSGVWDLTSGKKLHQFDGRQFIRFQVALTADGTVLASSDVGASNLIRLWDPTTGKELRRFPLKGRSAWALAFAPDGKTMAVRTGSPFALDKVPDEQDFRLALWDVETGKEVRILERGGPAVRIGLAFSPDAKILAASTGPTISLFDVTTGKDLMSQAGHGRGVKTIAFSAKKWRLISADEGGQLRFWDPASGKAAGDLAVPKQELDHLALSSDGRFFAFVDRKNVPHLWDIAAGREIRNFEKDAGTLLNFSPDGRILAIGARFWDTITGKELPQLRDKEALAVAISPKGDKVAFGLVGLRLNEIQLCDLATGREIWRVDARCDENAISFVLFSPDGKTIASSDDSRMIRLWDVATATERGQGFSHGQRPPKQGQSVVAGCVLAFSPDSTILASGSYEGTIRLWDLATAKERVRFTGHEGGIKALAFSPDGKTLASGSNDTTVLIWDVAGSLAKNVNSRE
jgi:WD40 repeat protein